MDVVTPADRTPSAELAGEGSGDAGSHFGRRIEVWFDRQDERKLGLILLGLGLAGAATLIFWLSKNNTYMADEWGWIDYAGGGSFVDMFKPLNQHLSVLVLLLTKLGLSIWGTSGAYLPFKFVLVFGVLASGVLVYVFARPRLGPLVALAPAMVPMYLGTATVVLLHPLIGLQIVYSIGFGLGAFVALDRGSKAGDITASVLVVLSLACFSIGIAFLAGVAVAVLLAPSRVRRAYVWLAPAILYGAWRLWANKYGTTGGPELANVPAVPFYMSDSLATTIGSLFGISGLVPVSGTSLFLEGFRFETATVAFVFAAFEATAIILVARRLAPNRPLTPMFWGTLAVLLALWTIQGLVIVGGRTPAETRYIYPGAVALAMFAVAALRGVRITRFAVVVVLALTAVGIIGNLPRWNYGRNLIDYLAPRTLASTGVMQLVGPENADPAYNVSYDTPNAVAAGALSIPASAYYTISARSGPLGYSPAEILELEDPIREGTDEVIVRLLRLDLAGAGPNAARNCERIPANTAGSGVELPRNGAVLQAENGTPVLLRRFATNAHAVVGQLQLGKTAILRIPPDRETARIPWMLETKRPTALSVCPIG